MAKNPISTPNPYKKMFRGNRAKVLKDMHRPEGAGNFDNADDHALMAHIDLKEGTIQHTPAVDADIANKKYVDDNAGIGTWTDTSTNTGSNKSLALGSNTITGTKAEFDTAVTDGNIAYTGGAHHDGFSDFVANEHIDWTSTTSNFSTSGTLGVDNAAIFNESGADVDFRIEGDTEANLFFVNAGTDRVGIGTASPVCELDVNGGFAVNIVNKAGNYTASSSDHTITGDSTFGSSTITLPAAADVKGIIYNIKKVDGSSNPVTIAANASEKIDGATTAVLNTQYESITIHCDGFKWAII